MYSKLDRKRIRKLADTAHERLLLGELSKLRAGIESVENGEISAIEMNHRIHVFHNGISRELYKRFTGSASEFAVFRAYIDGALTDIDFAGASNTIISERDQFILLHKDMQDDA
ncbi:hypothetical protein MFFC18_21170 [Mariniblastus fucicola]|uniref:Uncharacterized protein n=1 Tax=Mariniblastus fucicola TaxID=980251 RepID=A0A5B9PHA5_9BACT|nr:hypothetical protein MFFC18_18310 [Mariniblastus fucicola]QEG22241.1 hypothetical protein MFFC18_21170 [Mariniblastus fucicola]